MVSIIIPIYNAERHLEQCLESVRSQTYTDFECILIDDGSTDNSTNICDQWGKKDERFLVIHKKNAGVSSARNDGIEKARGKHILFVDSDDWLEANYVSAMVSHCDDAELTISGQIREFTDGRQKAYTPHQETSFQMNTKNTAFFTQLCEDWLLYAPHEKLFHRDIIEQNAIRFKEGCDYGEDLLFNFQYLEHVNTILTLERALYHYRCNEESLSNRFRPNQFDEDYGQWQVVASFFQKKELWNEASKPYLFRRLWGIVYDGIFLYPKLENTSSSYVKHILAIPEINELKQYQGHFHCSLWIKWMILHRQALILSSYLKASLIHTNHPCYKNH